MPAFASAAAPASSIQILDLSVDGFRATTHLQLEKGSDVWLRLPGLEPYQAKVMWAKGNFVGCAFERPLHPAVLEMIVKKTGRTLSGCGHWPLWLRFGFYPQLC